MFYENKKNRPLKEEKYFCYIFFKLKAWVRTFKTFKTLNFDLFT